MANLNHLSLIEDIDLWNEWRLRHPEILPDLTGTDFSNYNLQGINLSDVNLDGVNFSNANLIEVNFTKANLHRANLSSANIRRANCYKTCLTEANLNKAYLAETDLSMANLHSANLSEANLSESYLIKANLKNANLSGANLTGATLTEAQLIGTNFNQANLTEVDLSGVLAVYAQFFEAILTGVNIEGWVIDETTKVNHVFCNYFYVKPHEKKILSHSKIPINFNQELNKIDEDDFVFSESDIIPEKISTQILNDEIINQEHEAELQRLIWEKESIENKIAELESKLVKKKLNYLVNI